MNDRKVAIVTGASSGIGKETSLALARRGYVVLLAARRVDRLEETARMCAAAGGGARVVPTDVADFGQVQALVQRGVDEFGRVDVMVNNAGYGVNARVHETSDQQMRRIFDVNFYGVFYGCRAIAPVMMNQRSGHIFNVSSVIGKRGTPFNGAYCATKFAICGLTDSMRIEMIPYNVRVTCVMPGLTETEFVDRVDDSRAGRRRAGGHRIRRPQKSSIVAKKIAATVGKTKPELVFTAGGKFLVFISALSPRLADVMMRVYHDRLLAARKPL